MTHASAQSRSSSSRIKRLVRAAGACGLEELEPRALFAADPVTTNNPLWTALNGGARIDGNITDAEWGNVPAIVVTEPNLDQTNVTLKVKYSTRGLMIAADVRDTRLWADGSGGGAGNIWEFWKDDSMQFFFDPQNTRAKALPASGRSLGFNLGRMSSPVNGPGRVLRYDFLRGNGKGAGVVVNPGGALSTGIRWATRINGTLNNNSDTDVGWTTELVIPWAALGMSGRPADGQTIGMNFDINFDNDGGDRNVVYYGTNSDPAKRLGDRVVDDHVNATFSSFNYSDSGWHGPIDYAVLQFVDRAAAARPTAIADLGTSSVSGYGARLDFTAPAATQAGTGNVSSYQIRVSSAPIVTEDDWAAAAPVDNDFVPHLQGKAESLRIGRLTPGTQYYVAVRAADLAGRVGDIASTSFTTQTELEDTSGGQRIMVSPVGNTLMTEAGDPFVMVGGTVGVSSLYVRGLYSGLLWASGADQFIDYSTRNDEGTADGYFDSLASYGVNTLRVQLERVQLENTAAARSKLPEGMAWLEWRQPGDAQSEFNSNMRDFLYGMMEQAARTGVRIILQTFNNFNYSSNFDLTPYSTANGGPITSMNDFFWNSQVLAMCETRMDVLADWIRASPYAYTVMGFELVNEWDGGKGSHPELAEMRQRSKFMVNLAAHVHAYDPDLNVMSTTIGFALRGPIARAVFLSDAFDMLDPHFYTPSTSEPVNNPDADKSVRPGMDYGALAAYWLTSRRDNRPVQNAEWDLVGKNWPGGASYYTGYSSDADPAHPYTLEEDEAIYRVTSWVSIASGLAGSGLRIGGSELRDTYPDTPTPETTGYLPVPLSIGMRQIQKSVSEFVSGEVGSMEFDWTSYRTQTLAGRLGFSGTGGHTLHAWGSTDGQQGLAYVLNDRGTGGSTVSGASLNVEGLVSGAAYDFEFWSTGADAHVVGTLAGVIASKTTGVALPDFGTDVVMKFRRVG